MGAVKDLYHEEICAMAADQGDPGNGPFDTDSEEYRRQLEQMETDSWDGKARYPAGKFDDENIPF